MSMAMPINEQGQSGRPEGPSYHPNPGGRLREEGLGESDRNFALAIHLTPFSCFFLGPIAFIVPLVLWLVRKDDSPFVDDHGREVLNYLLSSALFAILLVWTIVVPLVLMVLVGVNLVRGAIAASNGEYFRFPMTIRFLT